MKLTLHSLILASVTMAAAALTVNPAVAQTKVNVPFNFVAAGKNCPAGTYSVQVGNLGNSIKLSGPTGSFTWIVRPADPLTQDKQASLKFDRMGQTYQLRSVQLHAQVTNRLDKKYRHAPSAPLIARNE